jgi:hypothetical protein
MFNRRGLEPVTLAQEDHLIADCVNVLHDAFATEGRLAISRAHRGLGPQPQ